MSNLNLTAKGKSVTVVLNNRLVKGKIKAISSDTVLVKLRNGLGTGNFPVDMVFLFTGVDGCKKCLGSGRKIPHVKVLNGVGGSVECDCVINN